MPAIASKHQNTVCNNIVTSIIGVGIAEFITLPICTAKTVFQTNLNHRSMIDVFKHIYQTNGLRGFYNASYVASSTQIIATSLKYTSYQFLKKYNNSNTFLSNAINGVVANISVSLVTHPLDVVRINQQLCTFNFNQYIKNPTAWYQGYRFTLGKNIMGGIIYLPLYDLMNQRIMNPMLSGFTTAIIGTVIMHPIDLFKTRTIGNQSNIYIQNIFRGLGINLARIVPHFTIMMTVIDWIKKYY